MRKQSQELERERPNPGNMKCLDLAMPEASDIPENLAYINQLICLRFLKITAKSLEFLANI